MNGTQVYSWHGCVLDLEVDEGSLKDVIDVA